MDIVLQMKVGKGASGYHVTAIPARFGFTDDNRYRAETIEGCGAIAQAVLRLSEAQQARDDEAARVARNALDRFR